MMNKKLAMVLYSGLLVFSLNVMATTVALVAPQPTDIPANIRNAIQSDVVVSILESELVNMPNITLAERIDAKQSVQELKFEQSHGVSATERNNFGHMKAVQYLIIPKIIYATKQDKTIHFTNFSEVNTAYQIELQIKVVNTSNNTLVYAKNFDASGVFKGNNNDNWTQLLREAAAKLATDPTFQQKIAKSTPKPTSRVVMDTIKFEVAEDATIFINGDYVGVGNVTAHYKNGTKLDVKVIRPGYATWHHPVKVSKGLVVTVINAKLNTQEMR